MHPLLTLCAAHQEPGHGLSRKEGISLRNLGTEEVCSLYGSRGRPPGHQVTKVCALVTGAWPLQKGKGLEEQGAGVLNS